MPLVGQLEAVERQSSRLKSNEQQAAETLQQFGQLGAIDQQMSTNAAEEPGNSIVVAKLMPPMPSHRGMGSLAKLRGEQS